MANIILFDSEERDHLLPLTFTRPICDLRVGILTIREKWEHLLGGKASFITQDFLSEKYDITISEDNFIINGAVLPTRQLCDMIKSIRNNEAILKNGKLVAARIDRSQFMYVMENDEIDELDAYDISNTITINKISNLWDIYSMNASEMQNDFELLTKGRKSQPLSDTNNILGRENIFLEPGAKVEFATLNATTGPIYIGENAEIMEGAIIRGGLALGEQSVVKMGAKIYGATTTGPHCKIGGEVNNCVFIGYSNKGHDGFLGNSVIGEWCNLGADTNTSNLKNNYEEVKLWNYPKGGFVKTGQQFCGLMMGDHSKTGINTMLNTGTVIGVSANVFGSGFPRNFIPSFSWGGASGFSTYRTDKAFDTAERMMSRRGKELDAVERVILLTIAEKTAAHRRWE